MNCKANFGALPVPAASAADKIRARRATLSGRALLAHDRLTSMFEATLAEELAEEEIDNADA